MILKKLNNNNNNKNNYSNDNDNDNFVLNNFYIY